MLSRMLPKPVAKTAANVLFVKERTNGPLRNATTRYETPATRPTQPIELNSFLGTTCLWHSEHHLVPSLI